MVPQPVQTPALQQFQQQTQYGQQPINGIVKVNSRESALQCQLPPNSTSQPFFDNNGKTFYIVSTDGTGTKTIESFDFAPHVDEPTISIDGANFVSREEFDQFVAKVGAALEAINGANATVPATTANTSGGLEGGGLQHKEDDGGGRLGSGRQSRGK